MPRQADLPPRIPYIKKTGDGGAVYDTVSPKMRKGIGLNQSFIKEEQPNWVTDLLDDDDSESKRVSETGSLKLAVDRTGVRDSSESKYGPNSPRGLGKPLFQGNGVASVFNEYVRYKNDIDESFSALKVGSFEPTTLIKNESFSVSKVGAFEDTCGPNGEVVMPENKLVKRHPGQRTRMRKVQYIAELEKTVDVLQEVESDLATKVSSLIHQRLSLSVENTKLKQRIIRLQQRKLIADGQTNTLRKEFEMLKYRNSNSNSCSNVNSLLVLGSSVDPHWQMLDIGKLNLN